VKRTRMRAVSPKRRDDLREWDRVKTLIRIRSGGRCEVVVDGHRCVRDAKDGHHVVKRSQGGDGSVQGVIDVCRPCHDRTDFPYYLGRLVIRALGHQRFACEVRWDVSKAAVLRREQLVAEHGGATATRPA